MVFNRRTECRVARVLALSDVNDVGILLTKDSAHSSAVCSCCWASSTDPKQFSETGKDDRSTNLAAGEDERCEGN